MSAKMPMGINAGRYDDEELISLTGDYHVLNQLDRDDLYDILEELAMRFSGLLDEQAES